MTYHLGAGPAKVHLTVVSDWSTKPVYNVIAKIPGAESPDEWVIRGNHRDGWVYGAWDPLSGTIAMMAEAKAIGGLLKSGWKPRRTLIYASWDGEEAGLLGSTEWAEQHASELQRKAVLYLNSDENGRGFLRASGSHSLERFVNEVAGSVKDPQTGVSVQTRLRAYLQVRAREKDASDAQKKNGLKAGEGGDLPLTAMGSGSDYSPFIQHLGIAALQLYYYGEDDQEGVYHSSYDTFEHYVRFGDPQFAYGIAESQTIGHAILRMTSAEVLPFRFTSFADTVAGYLNEVRDLANGKRKSAEELAKLLDGKAYELAADPTRSVAAPEREPAVPYLNFAPLENVVARLKKSAAAYDEAAARALAVTPGLNQSKRRALNAELLGMERVLTDSRGLPGRDWYKHLIYAPGLLTGYGAKTLPGVREAIEQNRWDEASEYIVRTAAAVALYCDRLERAAALY
jgi:N-acetylated-alpha-linked acidic dipeptidase